MDRISNEILATRITRTMAHEMNPDLHRAGLPTLQGAKSLGEYRARITRAQRSVFDEKILLVPAPVSTGHVRAKIREASARKAALVALSAHVNAA